MPANANRPRAHLIAKMAYKDIPWSKLNKEFPGVWSIIGSDMDTARPARRHFGQDPVLEMAADGSCAAGTESASSWADMKRVLRRIQSERFIKFDGAETDSFQSARLFLSFDEAVAFCQTHNLAEVELVVRTEGESEYTLPVPTEYVIVGEEEDGNETYVQRDAQATATTEAYEASAGAVPEATVQIFEETPVPERDIGLAVQVHETPRQTEASPTAPEDEDDTLCILLDETEAAILEYADFEQAAHALEYHSSPPERCDCCGADLSERWFFVDGRVRGSGEWRDLCSQCFFTTGARIGWGKGQLYQRQADGRWLLVGGFPH